MRKIFSITTSIGAILALSLGAASANEIKSFSVNPVPGFNKAPVITVYSSDGETYDRIDETNVTKARVRAKMICRFGNNFMNSGKAYEAHLTLQGHTPVGATDPSDGTTLWAIGKDGNGQLSRNFRWASDPDSSKFTEFCNNEVEKRLSEQPDKTKYHIMAEGFTSDYPASLVAKVNFTCNPTLGGFIDSKTKSTMINSRVICKSSALAEKKIPKPTVEVKSIQLPSMVEKLKLKSDRENFRGTCPVMVTFSGTITARYKGDVKYRLVNLQEPHKSSPTYTLKFSKPGTKSILPCTTSVKQPEASTTLSAGGDKKPWSKSATYRLEAEGADGKKMSTTAEYNVECLSLKKMQIIMPEPQTRKGKDE